MEGLLVFMVCEKYDICLGFICKKFCAYLEDVIVFLEKKKYFSLFCNVVKRRGCRKEFK